MSEKDITEINIIYNFNGENNINIFGYNFIKNNKNICKMIIDNKEYELAEKYKVKRSNNNKLKIKLKGITILLEIIPQKKSEKLSFLRVDYSRKSFIFEI